MKRRWHRNSRKRRLVEVSIAVLFVCGLVLLMPRIATTVSSVFMYPFHVTSTWLRESDDAIPTFFRDRQTMREEIERLEDELRIAKNNTVTEQHLLQENTHLRSLLGVTTESRIAAAVIARPNELPYDLLQIDQGASAGIEVGAPVFVGQDVAIGLVTHVASEYSFVELFTSPDFEATVFISGPNIVATIEGYGGGVARVRVPQGIPLTVGNLVYLPSIESGVFGRISFVENLPTQPQQYGYVMPDIAISELHRVAVGRVSQIARDPSEVDAAIQEYLSTSLLIPDLTLGVATSTGDSSTTTSASLSESSNQ